MAQVKEKTFMVKLATFIVDKRNLFFLLTVIGLIFSVFSRNWVEVENDLTYYLPEDAETKLALNLMEEQFTTYGTAEVMVANLTYSQAEALRDTLADVKGVQSVDFDETTDHYASASALFTVTFDSDETDDACLTALDAVRETLADYDLYLSTDLGNTLQETIDSEVSVIMVYVAVIVVIVLTLTSRTFGEVPVLLLTFVVAMVLNQGTNFLLGKISFVSNSVTSILQLALSLDYAVILCNHFKEQHQTLPIREAAIAETRKLVALLEDTLDYNDQALTQLQSFCAETKAACDAILTGMDALETAFAPIKNGPAQPDTSALRAEVAALREAVTTLEATIGRAGEELAIRGAVSPGTQAQLREDLLAVLDGCAYVTKALAEVVVNTDLSALRDQDLETLRQIAASLQTAMSSFRSAIAHLSAAMGHLQDFFGTLRTLNAHLDGILAQLDAALQQAEAAADSLSSAFSRMAKWARDLSQEEPGSFTPLGPGAEESGSALNASLTGISSEISALNTELSRSNTALISDLRAVNAQFMKVMNLFLNVLNDTQNVNYEDVYEDVSDESLQSATRGKVLECANYGAVTADRNAGGIAGSMAIEYDLDPEDDLQTEGQRSTRFTYQTKAILLSCQNYGTVQAKKSCAGGITGRMDLGTVSQCGGWGDVESESGDYVGGVAGLSLSSIRGSWAKCALSGGRYVGGIAGSGSRVTDCLSLVEITEAAQQSGAIAGEITGDYQGNRFVSETLAGVDRVSLSGKAEAVSYDQLAGLDAAPENFRRLTLRFVADGRTLKEQTFDYGASFPESAYPDAPEKDGCYVCWDRESLHELHFDTTVTAVYEPYVTTLSSDPQDAHPALLVEGKFRLGERMEAQQSTSPVPGSGSLVETWTLTIPEDGEASHTVRWRLPDTEETYTVYLKEDGAWRKTKGPKESECELQTEAH